MSSAMVYLPSGGRSVLNPWFIGASVVIPAFMGAVGTTIVGVARPYIAGGLSAPAADDLWVMTSYLAANAFILPITGWLSAHFGRRNYFLWSIAVFTIASVLCGLATSLLLLILFRVIQGLAAGGLQPSSQAILLDSIPPEKQGAAQTMFSIAILVGPIVGPVLSGWLVINYGWRWIFYINVPVGLVAFLVCYALLEDPEYLRQERAERKKQPLNFDGIGLGLVAVVVASWEVMVSKGQEWDWLGDPFWRMQTLLIVFVLALAGLLYRELTNSSPVINFWVLRERNFAVSCGITFGALAVLYASSIALPLLLLTSFGYDAYAAGHVLWPAGVFAVLTMLVVGRLLGWGTDARWLIAAGLLFMAAGNYWMALMNLHISPSLAIWPRVVTIIGLALMFAPLNVAAFLYIPRHVRGAAVGLLALLRNEGSSFGTSALQTLQERRSQFHTARAGEFLDPFNPATTSLRGETMVEKDSLRFTKMALNNGSGAIPALGFGTLIPDPIATRTATRAALEAGFRQLDASERYRNEKEVGEAMQEVFKAGNIKREEVFIGTKVWNNNHRPERVKPAFEASLKKLQLDYVDLYLIHTPFAFQPGDEQDPRDANSNVIYDKGVTLLDTWRALEVLVDEGRCKAIGLSDVSLGQTQAIFEAARIKPAVVHVESHPYLPQWELLDYCRKNGIVFQAFAALGHSSEPNLLQDPVITAIAKRVNKTPAQVLLAWAIQRGTALLTTSKTPSRIQENFEVSALPEEAVREISEGINLRVRFNPVVETGVPGFIPRGKGG
jgi:MFS transporter, DHA2 family, multidrug resistance protein